MSKKKIVIEPNPILRKKSNILEKVDGELRKLMDDMLETMYDAPGIGLAAVQIGVLKRTKEAYAKRNDFIFKGEYAIQWRMHFIKLICGLSILNKPNSVPASYVGINNPKNMCFAIASVHCFLRCTRCIQMMKKIARLIAF